MRHSRSLDVDVTLMVEPPPEQQYITTKKWGWSITIEFKQDLPPIRPERFGKLSVLLLLTETDRVLVGTKFVTVRTDRPDMYDRYELAYAVCECFGLSMGQVRFH